MSELLRDPYRRGVTLDGLRRLGRARGSRGHRTGAEGPRPQHAFRSGVSVQDWAGALLIAAPVWFNATFTLLAKRFDYPDILRRPTDEILRRFRAGGSNLILLWWAFMFSGLVFIAAAVLLGQSLAGSAIAPLATTIGVLAGLVQVLGLLRWSYLVPSLARSYVMAHGGGTSETDAAIFRAMHQFVGVGIGEHLGYLLTGLWSLLIGFAIVFGDVVPPWLGWPGMAIGVGIIVGSAEFLGPNEERGWSIVDPAISVLYIAWSVWLVALGIALIV
jgi:hypothetical protein